MTYEQPIEGWEAIGKFFGVSGRAAIRRRHSLLRGNAIFYAWKQRKGHPPVKVVRAWPEKLREWVSQRSNFF